MRILIRNEVVNTRYMVKAKVLGKTLHITYAGYEDTVFVFETEDQAFRTLTKLSNME